MNLRKQLAPLKRITRSLHLHIFLLGILLCLLFWFRIESSYETEIFDNIRDKIEQTLPANSSKDSFALAAMHMTYYLQERRSLVFGKQVFNSMKVKYFHPVTVDLMTGNSACGSAAYVLARILKSNGHDVKIFTTNFNAEGGIDKKSDDPNVVYGFPKNYLHGGLISRMKNLPSLIYSKDNKKAFDMLLASFQPDVIHCFSLNIALSPSLLEACKERNVPVVMSCNDYKHICTNYRLYHHGKVCTDCKGGKLYMSVINNCCKHSFAFSVASSIEAYVHESKDIFRKNIHTFSYESNFMLNIYN